MDKAPKSFRRQIVAAGRRNAGKSTLINRLTGKEISIVSPIPGTTTDPVEIAMEMPGAGAVVLVDTGGIDDEGDVGALRVRRSLETFERADLILLVCREWGDWEEKLVREIGNKRFLVIFNGVDVATIDHPHMVADLLTCDIAALTARIVAALPESGDGLLVADLVRPNGTVLLVTPIDPGAPKGRLILPQVQVMRELLDAHARVLLCQCEEVAGMIRDFGHCVDLIVTDSQAFAEVAKVVPRELPLTGFSVLFSRAKGDLRTMVEGAKAIDALRDGSRVIIAEACTHHATDDDIGSVKIPRLLRKKSGKNLRIDNIKGTLSQDDLRDCELIVHCGACIWNRARMQARLELSISLNIPITNYGICIAHCLGILDRATEVFFRTLCPE